MLTKQNILAAAALVAIVGAIAAIEFMKPDRVGSAGGAIVVLPEGDRQEMKAREYPPAVDISTPDAFINTEPFTIAENIGKKVVLVDFWTYSCINCQRTTPYLNAWHERYADDGLLIIGVHTPEFEFEKELENVQRAVDEFGIKFPIVLDNDYSTWTSYKNRYWPRKYLIDIDGYIVYDHIGEGAYEETEKKIVELLRERKAVLKEGGAVAMEDGAPASADTVDFGKIQTPETYLGAARVQYLVNLPQNSCLSGTCSYSFSGRDSFTGYELMGSWMMDKEYAHLDSGEGAIRISFEASKANLVAGAEMPVRAEILLDGAPVTAESAGIDVQDGIVIFEADTLYNLIDLKGEYGKHILEIRFLDPGVSAFAFTFG